MLLPGGGLLDVFVSAEHVADEAIVVRYALALWISRSVSTDKIPKQTGYLAASKLERSVCTDTLQGLVHFSC